MSKRTRKPIAVGDFVQSISLGAGRSNKGGAVTGIRTGRDFDLLEVVWSDGRVGEFPAHDLVRAISKSATDLVRGEQVHCTWPDGRTERCTFLSVEGNDVYMQENENSVGFDLFVDGNGFFDAVDEAVLVRPV